MNVSVTGKNGLTITEAMEKHATNSVSKIKEFFKTDEKIDVRVVCKVYKEGHKVEITCNLKNLILRAEIIDNDMYLAIDHCVDKIISQIKKHNGQVKNKLAKDGLSNAFNEEIDVKAMQTELLAQSLVKNKKIDLQPMSVEEAISEMELVGHKFFVFLNQETNNVSVVYLRDDFDYAVIDTTA